MFKMVFLLKLFSKGCQIIMSTVSQNQVVVEIEDKQDNLLRLPYFVSVEQLSADDVLHLLQRAQYFKNGGEVPALNRPIFCTNMFFENSTRTHTSFEVAERRLGLTVIPFDPSHSSVKKGENLYDTELTMASLGIELSVIRHPENAYYNEIIHPKEGQHLQMGLVNAGDGSGQHPSQSMLDMMTIYNEFGHFDGLKIMIVGDLTNSRVARSNMEILNTLGAEVYFSGPEYWYDAEEFSKYGTYVKNIDDEIPELDVLMLLRVQHERHNGAEAKTEQLFDAKDYNAAYGLNQRRYDMLKDDAIIMHPGPINRGVEWDGDLVEAPKSRYAVQMHNGVFVRMAMIEAVLRGRKLGGLE